MLLLFSNDVILRAAIPLPVFVLTSWRKMSAHESRKMARDTNPGLSLALMKKAVPGKTEKWLPFENR